MFDLYLITPERPPAEILAKTERLLAAAPKERIAVQLRAAHLAPDERNALAQALRAATRKRGVPLLISGELRLAREIGADGVQLPERGPSVVAARVELGTGALIGASRHDLAGVLAAHRAGASFATLSPIYAVPGKDEPLGVAGFAMVARATALPLFALGGITLARAPVVLRSGAHGLAVIRELFDSERPEHALDQLLSAIEAARKEARAHPGNHG